MYKSEEQKKKSNNNNKKCTYAGPQYVILRESGEGSKV